MEEIIHSLLSVPTIIFVVGGTIAVTAIVAGVIGKVATTRAAERTRREMAAYVAEGSIDPDKAIQILNAGRGSDEV